MMHRAAPVLAVLLSCLPLTLAAQTSRPSDDALVVAPPAGARFDAAESAWLAEDSQEDYDEPFAVYVYHVDRPIEDVASHFRRGMVVPTTEERAELRSDGYTDAEIDEMVQEDLASLDEYQPLEWDEDQMVPPDVLAEQVRQYEEATGEDVGLDLAEYRDLYARYGDVVQRSTEVELVSYMASEDGGTVWVELSSPYFAESDQTVTEGTTIVYWVVEGY